MTVRVPVVSSDECLRHQPDAEIWLGVRTAGTELARTAGGDPRRDGRGRGGADRRQAV